MPRMIFRVTYLVLIWTFLAGVVYQTYLAGLAAVSGAISWTAHVQLGFLLTLAALLQLVLVLPARLPRPAGWMSLGLFIALIAQLLFLWERDSPVSALHPVMALIVFYLSWRLAIAAARTVRGAALKDPQRAPGDDA